MTIQTLTAMAVLTGAAALACLCRAAILMVRDAPVSPWVSLLAIAILARGLAVGAVDASNVTVHEISSTADVVLGAIAAIGCRSIIRTRRDAGSATSTARLQLAHAEEVRADAA